jgi:hypothetical protein
VVGILQATFHLEQLRQLYPAPWVKHPEYTYMHGSKRVRFEGESAGSTTSTAMKRLHHGGNDTITASAYWRGSVAALNLQALRINKDGVTHCQPADKDEKRGRGADEVAVGQMRVSMHFHEIDGWELGGHAFKDRVDDGAFAAPAPLACKMDDDDVL